MDVAVAVGVGVLLAIVGFRRRRRVATPEARRAAVRASVSRPRRFVNTTLTVARAAVGLAALAGIAWLAKQMFR